MSQHEQSQHEQPQPQPKPKKPKKPTDPSLKRPSERNILVYEAVRIGLRTQTAVARQFGISQPRVSQILRLVAPFYNRLFPGDELGQRLKESKRSQTIDYECYERRKKHYRQAELVFEQSQRPLVQKQWTYGGKDDEQNLEKTVISERDQRLSLDSVKVQERINDKIERSGWGRDGALRLWPKKTRDRGGVSPAKDSRPLGAAFDKLPPPEGLCEEEKMYWPKLMREEQELALGRMELYPGISLHRASVRPGPHWSYYPWRTEAEQNAALLADLVVRGQYTIEEYWQYLERTELSKPFAHPNVLTKDREGRWQLMDPRQVPLPAMTEERAALPAGSPERIYWPYKSRAEHYAMLRAEMVIRGHLSLDQYDSLNAWASWYMNEKYPDPLENVVRNRIAPEPNADCGVRNAEWEGEAPAEPPRDGVESSADCGMRSGRARLWPLKNPPSRRTTGFQPPKPRPVVGVWGAPTSHAVAP